MYRENIVLQMKIQITTKRKESKNYTKLSQRSHSLTVFHRTKRFSDCVKIFPPYTI